MKILIEFSLKIALVLILISAMSCANKKNWVITPESANAVNNNYEATITPERDSNRFYAGFRLEVVNKGNEELRIDWNRTAYVNNGRISGGFVFKGVIPEDIKNLSIPDDIVPAGEKFTKNISPFSMIARSPLKSGKEQVYTPGILPNGRNGINLVIRQGSKEYVEKMSFVIKEMIE